MENADPEETRRYKRIKRPPGEKPLMQDDELTYFVKGYVYEKEMQKLSAQMVGDLNNEYGNLTNAQALGIVLKDGDIAQQLSQPKPPQEPMTAPPLHLLVPNTNVNYYTQKKE